MSTPDSYAALIRPVIDRVYVGLRRASREQVREVYQRYGTRPSLEIDCYFGLLARPMPAPAYAAVTAYRQPSVEEVLAPGTVTVDEAGTWRLTELGREVALAVQLAVARGAQQAWSNPPIATMPGLAVVPRLADLIGRLLDAGCATGGPAYAAMVPAYEPPDASPAVRLTTRLGALRHHRADAHRAAWQAAGLSAEQIVAMPDGPERQAIEAETNRRDEPIYRALTQDERLELLAGLAALPG